MPRYIDVDEFINQICRDADYVIENNIENLKVELPKFCPPNATAIAIEMIKKAKTVDAIPIEWMWNWVKKDRKVNYGDYDLLVDIINDWRKENEAD